VEQLSIEIARRAVRHRPDDVLRAKAESPPKKCSSPWTASGLVITHAVLVELDAAVALDPGKAFPAYRISTSSHSKRSSGSPVGRGCACLVVRTA